MNWSSLGRRQRLWMLDWQSATLADLLAGPCGTDLARASYAARRAIAMDRPATTPLPHEEAGEIEGLCGLPEGSLRPFGRVPDEDDLPPPAFEGLETVDAPGDGIDEASVRVPAQRMAWLLDVAIRRDVAIATLVLAAALDPDDIERVVAGRAATVAATAVERAAAALGLPGGVALLPDPSMPRMLVEDGPGGRRVCLRARMSAPRAEAMRAAAAPATVGIEPCSGPTADAVAISMDAVLDHDAADRVLAVLTMPRSRL